MLNGRAAIVLLKVGLIKKTWYIFQNCSKLSDVVKHYVVEEDVYNAEIKNIEDKIPDITNVATNTTLYAKRKLG